MPNLILTNRCNAHCSFCFSNKEADKNEFTLNSLIERFKLIASINNSAINILGGEPTLNIYFDNILKFLINENCDICVFSNGLINHELVSRLKLLNGSYSFSINRSNPVLNEQTIGLYKKLGYRVQLSVTLYKMNQRMGHIFNEIEKYCLKRHYRIGIALPNFPNNENIYIGLKDYPAISRLLYSNILKGIKKGIYPQFDCGFPYCFFSDQQHYEFQESGVAFKSTCGVIPDITLTSVFPCFPLCKLAVNYDVQANWPTLNQKLNRLLQGFNSSLLYEKCKECEYLLSGLCSGGCKAYTEKQSL